MSPLGRGLASLIPRRSLDAKELIDKVDSGDLDFDAEQASTAKTSPKKAETTSKGSHAAYALRRQLSVVEDTDEEEDEELLAPPTKPNVTPIPFDPSTDEVPVVPPPPPAPPAAPEESAVTPKPEVIVAEETDANAGWRKHEENVVQIPVNEIAVNHLQPRHEFDPVRMEELISSISAHGILQPLVLRRMDQGYELIAGERRLRAAKQLGWDKVPCVIRKDVHTERAQLELALIENIQRRDLNPIETALAFRRLTHEYGLSHEEIAQQVGVGRAAITNTLRLLQLPEEVQQGVSEGKITAAHGRCVLMIPDVEKQLTFYRHLLQEKITVRQAEIRARRVRRAMEVTDTRREKGPPRVMAARRWTIPLEEHYGSATRVRFLPKRNHFEVVFVAYTEEELDQLVDRLLKGEKVESVAGLTPGPDHQGTEEV